MSYKNVDLYVFVYISWQKYLGMQCGVDQFLQRVICRKHLSEAKWLFCVCIVSSKEAMLRAMLNWNDGI